jgi:hypothetical protein
MARATQRIDRIASASFGSVASLLSGPRPLDSRLGCAFDAHDAGQVRCARTESFGQTDHHHQWIKSDGKSRHVFSLVIDFVG